MLVLAGFLESLVLVLAGFLESLDDFYMLSSDENRLVLLQTTNNIFNQTLYDDVSAESMLAWQRVRIASAMATSGRQWSDTFQRYNSGAVGLCTLFSAPETSSFFNKEKFSSNVHVELFMLAIVGTYNNQYMIIDLSKVHLNSHIDDDALWVVEQVPGLVVGADWFGTQLRNNVQGRMTCPQCRAQIP